jgi:hypothetical protein
LNFEVHVLLAICKEGDGLTWKMYTSGLQGGVKPVVCSVGCRCQS